MSGGPASRASPGATPLYAPLLAAHAACGGALPAEARDRGRRRARGARLALGAAADRAARRAARAALADGGRAPRAAPTPVCARRAWVVLYGAAALEAAVALAPAWLWRAWIAPRVLGFPAGADAPETPGETDARAGVDGAGVLGRSRLRAPRRRPRRAAPRRALRDLRVTRAPADAARLFEAAGRPRAVSCAARRALRGSLAAAVALMLLAGGAELVFPSRGAQFRSLDEL